jgi:hypothetical protein
MGGVVVEGMELQLQSWSRSEVAIGCEGVGVVTGVFVAEDSEGWLGFPDEVGRGVLLRGAGVIRMLN